MSEINHAVDNPANPITASNDATARMLADSAPAVPTNKAETSAVKAPGDQQTTAAQANAIDKTFGQLTLTGFENQSPSPAMADARRVEDGYRSRYAENYGAMRAVGAVMGTHNPDINGHVTKDTLDKALTNSKTATAGDSHYSKDFLAGAQYLKDHWNDLAISPYKGRDGAIDARSAGDGKARMDEEQQGIAKQILAVEMKARNAEKPQAQEFTRGLHVEKGNVKAAQAPPSVDVKAAIVKQGAARHGEGPYQVAARVLGSDGKSLDDKQLKELTTAFKQSYEDERKANPKLHDMSGLRIGHQFLNKDNFNKVISHIADAALKERLTRIVGQDVAYHPPVITQIPPRPHHYPVPPIRPVLSGH